jgi:hypothetical protein
VRDGAHPLQDAAARQFARVMCGLAA